jgi:hypothetical protein
MPVDRRRVELEHLVGVLVRAIDDVRAGAGERELHDAAVVGGERAQLHGCRAAVDGHGVELIALVELGVGAVHDRVPSGRSAPAARRRPG